MTLSENKIVLPSEWAKQRFVQLTWPHEEMDWGYMIDEVNACFVEIATEIAKREPLLIVCCSEKKVRNLLSAAPVENIRFLSLLANDTWARDHGGITLFENGKRVVCDFTFNGWGMKFPANFDNLITRELFEKGAFEADTDYRNFLNFVLEGGSLESDGAGTLLTTAECLLSENRNNMSKGEVEDYLKETFGLQRVLWLHNGYLAGDDTDSHIDTLARFCGEDTIAYVRCDDTDDEHFEALEAMERELKEFKTLEGKPYRLLPLPMADAVYCDEERLPATYANFLIINGAVLLPFYNSPKDELARQQLQKAFPDREIVGVNCLPLIKQHGSLHCVTMQYV